MAGTDASPPKNAGAAEEAEGLPIGARFVRRKASGSLEELEGIARNLAGDRGRVGLSLANSAAVATLFRRLILCPQALFGAALTVGSTLASFYGTGGADPRSGWYGADMSWVLLSLAVVMPMAATVRLAFERRERALMAIATVRSTSYQLYLAHACWDWRVDPSGKEGRDQYNGEWLAHADAALTELLLLGNELSRYLTLPTYTRARHRVTASGKAEAARTAAVAYRLYDSISVRRTTNLTRLAERLKRSGLSLPEMIRIRKWERMLCGAIEELRMMKSYRTPQALRSFARIFSTFLPAFYGPHFAQLARDADSIELGVFFGLLSSLALTVLLEANALLEDPLVSNLAFDGIDVYGELIDLCGRELIGARSECFPDAPLFDCKLPEVASISA